MAYAAVATLAAPGAEMLHAWRAARVLVAANWPAIERIAALLHRNGTMTGAEVARVLQVARA
jgi:hypothetical protein